MAVKKVSRRGKGSYAVYAAECRYDKNRINALERHVKRNPGDIQAAKKLEAFKKTGQVAYARKSPNVKGGWNKARPRPDAVMSHEHIMSQLTRAEARRYAHEHRLNDSSKRSLTKEEREQERRSKAMFENLLLEINKRKSAESRAKKGKGKRRPTKGNQK